MDGVLILGDDDADPLDAHRPKVDQGAVAVGVAIHVAPPGGEGVAVLFGGLSSGRGRGGWRGGQEQGE